MVNWLLILCDELIVSYAINDHVTRSVTPHYPRFTDKANAPKYRLTGDRYGRHYWSSKGLFCFHVEGQIVCRLASTVAIFSLLLALVTLQLLPLMMATIDEADDDEILSISVEKTVSHSK